MDIVNIVVQLVSGAAGGNIAGALLKKFSLGFLGNSVAGIVGGGLGGQIAAMLTEGAVPAMADPAAAGPDIGAIIAQIVAGTIGGGILLAIVSVVRSLVSRA